MVATCTPSRITANRSKPPVTGSTALAVSCVGPQRGAPRNGFYGLRGRGSHLVVWRHDKNSQSSSSGASRQAKYTKAPASTFN